MSVLFLSWGFVLVRMSQENVIPVFPGQSEECPESGKHWEQSSEFTLVINSFHQVPKPSL